MEKACRQCEWKVNTDTVEYFYADLEAWSCQAGLNMKKTVREGGVFCSMRCAREFIARALETVWPQETNS